MDEQIWYYNLLVEMDLIFCHNDIDLKYYGGIQYLPYDYRVGEMGKWISNLGQYMVVLISVSIIRRCNTTTGPSV